MQIVKKDTLVNVDSKGKVRVINLFLEYDPECVCYKIQRSSGILNMKMITHTPIIVSRGKVKRTIEEQSLLQYNSELKKYLDKSYKNISDFNCSDISQFDPSQIIGQAKTDQKNVRKPMLCKVFDPEDKKNAGVTWAISRKYDGVRAFLYYYEGQVMTSSRGGQDYNIPATYILQDEYLKSLFKKNPNLILDGEIYRHGWYLSKISGLCRLETLNDEHKQLQFHCYDIVDETKPFKDRLDLLKEIKKDCPSDSKLVVVDHYIVTTNDEIDKYHDQFVAEGYEGAVIRDISQNYKCGARDRRMQKRKLFQSSEFTITGISDGLRDEDMCFTLKTKEGYPFKAKPTGTREDKQWYRDHINELIGKLGTVKFFGMTNTDTPVPNLPVFMGLRLKKDM